MRRNVAGLHRQLDRLEAAAESSLHTILLDDGTRVFVDHGDAIRLLMLFIRADAESYETGAPQAQVEHPHIPLYARSVEQPGDGALSQYVRHVCRDALAQRKATQ